jgi:hypothetical protein
LPIAVKVSINMAESAWRKLQPETLKVDILEIAASVSSLNSQRSRKPLLLTTSVSIVGVIRIS